MSAAGRSVLPFGAAPARSSFASVVLPSVFPVPFDFVRLLIVDMRHCVARQLMRVE